MIKIICLKEDLDHILKEASKYPCIDFELVILSQPDLIEEEERQYNENILMFAYLDGYKDAKEGKPIDYRTDHYVTEKSE